MKYSIIVPVFNTEHYLKKCLDSILNQSFVDFELILIDDGSKDNSLAICKEYERLDDRVRVIHKENGGVSSARNLGIENSKGEKILFFDSDDFVEPNTLEIIDKFDTDLIVYNSIVELNKKIIINKKTLEYDFFCGQLTDELLFSPCNKVFLTKIIKENSIRFDENISIGEDMLFSYDYIKYIDSVQIIKDKLYHYEIRDDSAMNNSRKDYLGQYLLTLDALKKRIGENTLVLSSWSMDVSAILFVRKYFSKMKHTEFKTYMKNYEVSNIRYYMVLCKDKKSFSKKMMKFFIKHKMYWLLQLAIKIKA